MVGIHMACRLLIDGKGSWIHDKDIKVNSYSMKASSRTTSIDILHMGKTKGIKATLLIPWSKDVLNMDNQSLISH